MTQPDYSGHAMIALYPPKDTAEEIHTAGGPDGLAPEDLHVTLVYLGDLADVQEYLDDIRSVIEDLATYNPPIHGSVGGVAQFAPDDEAADQVPVVALVDAPGLSDFRATLTSALDDAGVPYPDEHDFTPHMTLAYDSPDRPTLQMRRLPNNPVTFRDMVLVTGDERQSFPFGHSYQPIDPSLGFETDGIGAASAGEVDVESLLDALKSGLSDEGGQPVCVICAMGPDEVGSHLDNGDVPDTVTPVNGDMLDALLAAGTCTGPGPCVTSPLGLKHNWVTDAGGLPPYIRAIAHALGRHGRGEQGAIQMAIGTVKRWAKGVGNVTAATRARAAAAVAEWEALKARARVASAVLADDLVAFESEFATGIVASAFGLTADVGGPHHWKHGWIPLADSVASGIKTSERLPVDTTNAVDKVEFNDGTHGAIKHGMLNYKAGDDWVHDEPAHEVLAAHVAHSLGLPAPEVVRVGDQSIATRWVHGRHVVDKAEQRQHARSADGVKLAMMDAAIGNHDRHADNWMVDDNGHVIPMDHGQTFGPAFAKGLGKMGSNTGVFTKIHKTNLKWVDDEKPSPISGLHDQHLGYGPNNLHPNDAAKMRDALATTRPHFEALGRPEWHDEMMRRAHELVKNAQGKKEYLSDDPMKVPGLTAAGWDPSAHPRGQGGKFAPLSQGDGYKNPDGEKNKRVKHVQRMLKHLGISVGPAGVDGMLGPDTAGAIKSFQHAHGLNPTGTVNQNTIEALRNAAGRRARMTRTGIGWGGTGRPTRAQREHRQTARAINQSHRQIDRSVDRFQHRLNRIVRQTETGNFGLADAIPLTADGSLPVSGVALKAADTGRVLMLQRGLGDEDDPARGKWEFPGGCPEPGDLTSLHTGIREWQEEVGQPFPEGGVVHDTWRSPNGVYQGHIVVIPEESVLELHKGRNISNPDDPDGDESEQVAWWHPDDARKNPALREEARTTPWRDIVTADLSDAVPPDEAKPDDNHPGAVAASAVSASVGVDAPVTVDSLLVG